MGDRGNIVIRDRGDVFFYTHWRGSEMKDIVRGALSRHWRWKDGAYLARIVFCELVTGLEHEEHGFGISTYICDNSHPLLIVDVDRQEVYEREPSDLSAAGGINNLSFEEFCDGKPMPGD